MRDMLLLLLFCLIFGRSFSRKFRRGSVAACQIRKNCSERVRAERSDSHKATAKTRKDKRSSVLEKDGFKSYPWAVFKGLSPSPPCMISLFETLIVWVLKDVSWRQRVSQSVSRGRSRSRKLDGRVSLMTFSFSEM